MSDMYSQIQEVLASDPSNGDLFGNAVALSTHGHVALVARSGFSANSFAGAVSVFRYSDTKWIDQFEIGANVPNDGDQFGSSVSLSSSGLIAAIGARANSNSGGGYIFVDSDTFWIQHQQIFPSDGNAEDQFGAAIAISANGSTILVGASQAKIGSNVQQGAAYIFQYNGISWVQQQKIYASDGNANDMFGTAVALSSTGNTALVGAPQSGTAGLGLAYIFSRSDTVWSPQKKLQNPNNLSGESFGQSVALFDQGSAQIALVGANLDTIGGNFQQGAAYVFMRSDGSWPFQKQLLASDGAPNAQFGTSVDLGQRPEGHVTALIGAPGANKSYIFKRVENVWTQFQEITASDSALSNSFGNAVALAGHALIGLVGDAGFPSGSGQGSAYFFGAKPPTTPAPGTNTTLTSFLPDVLIATIFLYAGIAGMFLFNAFEE